MSDIKSKNLVENDELQKTRELRDEVTLDFFKALSDHNIVCPSCKGYESELQSLREENLRLKDDCKAVQNIDLEAMNIAASRFDVSLNNSGNKEFSPEQIILIVNSLLRTICTSVPKKEQLQEVKRQSDEINRLQLQSNKHELRAECADSLDKWLDDKGIPRKIGCDQLSLIGRVNEYKRLWEVAHEQAKGL